MPVVHLSRKTSLPRENISAANIVCKEYPHNEIAHKIIWDIVASNKQQTLKLSTLSRVAKQLILMESL